MSCMINKKIEKKLLKKLKELTHQPKAFTEIMRELYFEMIDLFEENGMNNTRIISHFFNILIHINLHDVFNNKKREKVCIDSIKYQILLFFEFLYHKFGDLENLTQMIEESLEEIKEKQKNVINHSLFLGKDNCLMLLKEWFNR